MAKQQKNTRLDCKKWQTKQKKNQQLITGVSGQRFQSDKLRCSRCEVAYGDAYWTSNQQKSHRHRQTKLVCRTCRSQGFHPRNISAYKCQTCKEDLGTWRFKYWQLWAYRRHPCMRLRCIQCIAEETEKKATAISCAAAAATSEADACESFTTHIVKETEQQKETRSKSKKWLPKQKTKQQKKTRSVGKRWQPHQLRCSKCKVACEDACWTQSQRRLHRERHTKLVCKACRAQGFHPRNLEAYTCQTCKGNLGTSRFNQVLLKNYKQRHYVRLECIQCVAQKTEQKAAATAHAAAAASSTADDMQLVDCLR